MTLAPSPDFTSRDYFHSLHAHAPINQQLIWAAIAHLGAPGAYLDLGCGDGTMVQALHCLAHPALGVEFHESAKQVIEQVSPNARVILRDLRRPFRLSGAFDLTSCIDVSQHIDPLSFPIFLDNVVNHTDGWLIWTGQEHVRALEHSGLVVALRETVALSHTWKVLGGKERGDYLGESVCVLRRPQ